MYSLFLYPQCIAAYRGPHHFGGYKPKFGGKKPSASNWNAEYDTNITLLLVAGETRGPKGPEPLT